jgi:hypothetical protein
MIKSTLTSKKETIMAEQKLLSKIKRMHDFEFGDYLVTGRFTAEERKWLWINRNQLSEFRKALVNDFLDEEDED